MRTTDHGVRRAHRRTRESRSVWNSQCFDALEVLRRPASLEAGHRTTPSWSPRWESCRSMPPQGWHCESHSTPGPRNGALRAPFRCPGGGRTHTLPALSRMPLPLGYGALQTWIFSCQRAPALRGCPLRHTLLLTGDKVRSVRPRPKKRAFRIHPEGQIDAPQSNLGRTPCFHTRSGDLARIPTRGRVPRRVVQI
jgi:hypothetical protein